jgi:acid stress-induced BolA-like protein IbaG/YrbA
MTLEEFRDYVVQNAMYETIYTDGEGKSILVITLLDAFELMNKFKEKE